MKLPRRRFLQLAGVAVALPPLSESADAQAFPARPITIVVPFAAGGPIDALVRVTAVSMQGTLGQPLIIENVSGAAGNIGVGRVARAAPDGYTLVTGFWGTHVVNAAIYALPYDVVNDFEPILLMSRNAQIIVARKTMPVSDLKGVIDWLKANPDVAAAGTSGAGSPQHVFGVFFQHATGTHFRFVPYRGAAPTMQDLVGGPDVRRPDHRPAAGSHRQHQGLCGNGQQPLGGGPGHSNGGRGRIARVLLFCLDCAVCPQGHTEGYYRQAQRRRRGCA